MARTIDELPSPPGLPLLGNAHQLTRASRLHTVCERWASQYGPILRVKIGRRLVVGISDGDAVNMVLRERPEGFRRWREQQIVFDEMGLSGVFTAEGEQWKRQRRLVITALNTNHLHRYYSVIHTSAERLYRRLSDAAQAGRALDIGQEFTSYSLDITSALAFGHDLNTLERREGELQEHIERAFGMIVRRIGAPFPYWRWLKLPADRALDRSLVELHRATGQFVEQARQRMRERPELREQPENFLESMIAAQENDGAFTDEEIIGNALILLFAGEDTTAHTLGWTIWLLATYQDVQLRLAGEAQEVLGEHPYPADYHTVGQLPYTDAVLRESLRVKGVTPLITAEPLQDTTICDTHIPAGTQLLMLLRYPNLGDGFDPDRLLHGDEPSAPKVLTFGAGPRFCPGRNLAFLEAKTALSMIARNFRVELDGSAGPVSEFYNFVTIPKGLQVRLTPLPTGVPPALRSV
jgi:cytochrome P450